MRSRRVTRRPNAAQRGPLASVRRFPVESVACSSRRDAAHGERRRRRATPRAALGPGGLPVDRRRGDAELDAPAAHHRDLRREHRIAAHEGLGAVDRIDDPDMLRIHALGRGTLRRRSRPAESAPRRLRGSPASAAMSASVTGEPSALRAQATSPRVAARGSAPHAADAASSAASSRAEFAMRSHCGAAAASSTAA